jgi:hypothetical protein
MKQIRELRAVQIRIFPPDYIPYGYILRNDFVEYMSEKYKFNSKEIPFENMPGETPKILDFKSGEYKVDGKRIIINRLVFEDRRIVTETLSTSKEAAKLFTIISRDIKKFKIEGNFKASDTVYFGNETFCIASLDIDYMDVFSDKFKNFLSDDFLPCLENEPFEIYPKSIRFEVSFKTNDDLMKKRVTLSPKRLIVEPKTDHSLDEKVFSTSSPCDTDTHFKILELFEKRLQ